MRLVENDHGTGANPPDRRHLALIDTFALLASLPRLEQVSLCTAALHETHPGLQAHAVVMRVTWPKLLDA